jgi:hypothetical protein
MNRCFLCACVVGLSLIATARVTACDALAVGVMPQACLAASVEAPVAVAPQVVVSPVVAVTPSVAVVPTFSSAVFATQIVPVSVRPLAVRVRVAPRLFGSGLSRRCRF